MMPAILQFPPFRKTFLGDFVSDNDDMVIWVKT